MVLSSHKHTAMRILPEYNEGAWRAWLAQAPSHKHTTAQAYYRGGGVGAHSRSDCGIGLPPKQDRVATASRTNQTSPASDARTSACIPHASSVGRRQDTTFRSCAPLLSEGQRRAHQSRTHLWSLPQPSPQHYAAACMLWVTLLSCTSSPRPPTPPTLPVTHPRRHSGPAPFSRHGTYGLAQVALMLHGAAANALLI